MKRNQLKMVTQKDKTMNRKGLIRISIMVLISLGLNACVPELTIREPNRDTPESFPDHQDSVNTAEIDWKSYFSDPDLIALIDTALKNNQELNIVLQELEMARNEVDALRGEYQPFIDVGVDLGVDKVGRYTRNGVLEANNEIEPGEEFPEPLTEMRFEAMASWEIDIWRKLRNARESANKRYLASVEGRNFLITNLIAEIADSYYELMALDNELLIVLQNIQIQNDALRIVRLQKEATRVTELAVKRFEAQVLDTRSLQFGIQQRIVETENRLNYLLGRYPQPIPRSSENFQRLEPNSVKPGTPSQLLSHRPDIRQAELELEAARLDVAVARARFYPTAGLSAGLGLHAFNPAYLAVAPESIVYGLAGDLVAPVVNRKEIKATYFNANARQLQAVIEYEQTILNAYVEVVNQLSRMENLQSSFELKAEQVEALTESVDISNNLFRSARADYMEVLMTQREALESRFELIETKMQQMHSKVYIYRALGGGWE